MFNRILVPVDGSVSGLEALKYAIQFHKNYQSELIILSVYREHSMWKASMTLVNPELTSSTDNAMKDYAKDIAENSKAYAIKEGVDKIRSFYIGGGPAREIIKFSKKYKVDLIVLGSRGLSDSSKHLLGSVSHKVTSLADCPVLVV